MSRYSEVDVDFRHKDCLLESLSEMGITFKEYQELTPLHDYMGKTRENTKAHIIIDRKNWNSPVNDVGFVLNDKGEIQKAHIDEFFKSTGARKKFLNPLQAKYAEKVGRKTVSKMRLRVVGEESLPDGTKRLRIKR
jgi:hypothetical protein